jgi:hypothetical protein
MVKEYTAEFESGEGDSGSHPCGFDVKYPNKIQEK